MLSIATFHLIDIVRRPSILLILLAAHCYYCNSSQTKHLPSSLESICSYAVDDTILLATVQEIERLKPPELTNSQRTVLNGVNWTELHGSRNRKEKMAALGTISGIVQEQIKTLQQIPKIECEQRFTLKCGLNAACGFGCQVHHRIACLMMSYALNLPLIHDTEEDWPYESDWDDIFVPMGSNCTPGHYTFRVEWHTLDGRRVISRRPCPWCPFEELMAPLGDGIPVPRELGHLVELLHTKPFLWWIGQFIKFGLTLRDDIRLQLELDKQRIGWEEGTPIVGLHIRRTDKVTEGVERVHPVEKYFDNAFKYFNHKGLSDGQPMTVFIASDDHEILPEAIAKFAPPDWKILSFPENTTHAWPWERKADLFTILRDTMTLSHCQFVVCGFSSNICLMSVELKASQVLEPWRHVKSLDLHYIYMLWGETLPLNVVKT